MYAHYAKTRPQNSAVQSNSATGQPSSRRAANATTATALKPKPYRSVKIYLDRITIAGLHNYLYARGKYEKIAWNLTFLLAIAGTVYYLVPAVQEYLKFTIVLDIQYKTEPNLRLPNPWVCHTAINVSYILNQFDSVKPVLESDKRVQLIARRYQRKWNQMTPVSMDQMIQVALRFILTVPVWSEDSDWTTEHESQFAFEFIAITIRALGSRWTGIKAFYEIGTWGCSTIVMNCTLDGVVFDCCRDGPMGYSKALDKCFALDIRQTTNALLRRNQSKPKELQFETIINDKSSKFYFFDKEREKTIISFGNRASALFDYEEALEGGSISVINVKSTKKVKLVNCMDTYKYRPHLHPYTHPLIRKYFEEMVDPDRYSVAACQMGKLYEVLFMKCGCVPYYDSIRPQKDTDICTPAHLHACVYRAFQNEPTVVAGQKDGNIQHNRRKRSADHQPITSDPRPSIEDDVKRDLFHNIKQLMADECLQLCEAWTYDYTVFSTSIEDLEGNTSSINRTKITINFDPEYRVETEVYKMGSGAFITTMGYAFGLILGISAVTLVQLPIWSIVAYLFKRRHNKVSAMSKAPSLQTGQH